MAPPKGFLIRGPKAIGTHFLKNFAEPGVPREFYEQMFNDEIKSNLMGMEIVSVGQPTKWLRPEFDELVVCALPNPV